MRRLDKLERARIINLWKENQSLRETARISGHAIKTVTRWVKKSQAHGGDTSLEMTCKSGRPRAMDSATAAKALDLLLSDDCDGAEAAAQKLLSQGDTTTLISKSTLLKHAKKAAKDRGKPIHYSRGNPDEAPTPATMKKRVKWAKQHLNFNWSTVLFTDRKKFYFKYPGVKVAAGKWMEKGKKNRSVSVNHPQAVNVYAGISKFGATKAHIVAGTSHYKSPHKNMKGAAAKNITASEYKAVMMTTLLPEGQRIFTSGQGIYQWVYQQDNDPTHRRAPTYIKGYNLRSSTYIQSLDRWPPKSPDLNPIENLWAWATRKVNKMGCKSFHEYEKAVLNTIRRAPRPYLIKLIGSMRDRLKACIEAGGDRTKY